MGLSSTFRVCIATVIYVHMTTANCYRGTKACCVGYFWNDNKQQCEVCSEGYFGLNCSQLCPYPSYGKGCVETCDCPEPFCVPTFGCALREEKKIEKDFTIRSSQYSSTVEENSTSVEEWPETTLKNNRKVFSNVLQFSYLFVVVLVAVVFLITVTIVQMVIKRRLNRKHQLENNSSQVPQTENINSGQSQRVSNIYDTIRENAPESSQMSNVQSKKDSFRKNNVQNKYSDAANEYLDTRSVGFVSVRESDHFYSQL